MLDDLPVTGVIPIAEMIGEDEKETRLLRELSDRAKAFLSKFAWCEAITEFYFGEGIGGIIGIFLARMKPSRSGVDEFLWVIVGDLPSAHLVTADAHCPKEAVEAYIWEMRKWVELARRGQTSREVIPVNVPATPEWAEKLHSRLNSLEEIILPCFGE